MMDIEATSIYERNAEAWLNPDIRRCLNEGGTRSSKTWSILQLLILIAQNTKSALLISVVSETLPHLRKGCIRDFFKILGQEEKNNPRWNATKLICSFGLGKIEFFGADSWEKVSGLTRDILYLNEPNHISWNTAIGLDIRTNKFTFADWNPTSEFWAHEKWLQKDESGEWVGTPENALVRSTYLDALDVLPQGVIDNIESNKDKDPNWWNIYGLGKLGKVEGLVYPLFGQVDILPTGNTFYGLDFGYSNDPTTLIRCVINGEGLYCEELIYEKGMTNDAIAYRMAELGVEKHLDEIFADSAEPKSIEEIYRHGFNIKPAPKGPGSVEYGHQKVRQYKQYWTKDSVNGIKEQRNYRYIADKNGKLTDKTTHNFSHCMDARRYGIMGMFEPRETEEVIIYDAMEEVRDLELA